MDGKRKNLLEVNKIGSCFLDRYVRVNGKTITHIRFENDSPLLLTRKIYSSNRIDTIRLFFDHSIIL